MSDLTKYRNKIEQLKGHRKYLRTTLAGRKKTLATLQEQLNVAEEARRHIQIVSQQTQEELKFNIESIVSSALGAVFDDPYTFTADFETKRNKTECVLSFERDGQKINPLKGAGFGAVDVASFALRLSLWSLSTNRTAPVMLLDEPFKNLSRDLQYKAGQMVKLLSEKLSMQFIIVTHATDIIESSARAYKVHLANKVSVVKKIK